MANVANRSFALRLPARFCAGKTDTSPTAIGALVLAQERRNALDHRPAARARQSDAVLLPTGVENATASDGAHGRGAPAKLGDPLFGGFPAYRASSLDDTAFARYAAPDACTGSWRRHSGLMPRAALGDLVVRVVFDRTEKQVRWIYAAGIVAPMQDAQSFRNRAAKQFVARSMGWNHAPPIKRKSSVAAPGIVRGVPPLSVARRLPFPAAIRVANMLRVEPLKSRCHARSIIPERSAGNARPYGGIA